MKESDILVYVMDQMKLKIDKVLSGDSVKESLLYVRPNHVVNYLKTLGAEVEDDWDTNGWSWDFWIHATYNGTIYMISGDGYYNTHLSFELNTD